MSAHGVIKAIVSFDNLSSRFRYDVALERIPVNNDIEAVESLKKHLTESLGLKQLATKYGFRSFDHKLYRISKEPRGKTENFTITVQMGSGICGRFISDLFQWLWLLARLYHHDLPCVPKVFFSGSVGRTQAATSDRAKKAYCTQATTTRRERHRLRSRYL